MRLKNYLFLMIFSTLICWGAWLMVLFSVDPFQASFWNMAFFYLSLFLASAGSISIVGFLVRVYLFKSKEPYFRVVKKSFRHSLFFAALLIVALFLQSFRLLRWWNSIILILAFSFFEMSFLTEKKMVD